MISEFTGEAAEKLGGFPVNSPECMVNDQSVNNSWKNLVGGLYDINTFENLSQEKIRATIDLQLKIMEAIIAADGGHTNYMSCGSAS